MHAHEMDVHAYMDVAYLRRRPLAGKRLEATGVRFCDLQCCAQCLHLLVNLGPLRLGRYLCRLERRHLCT